MTAIVMATLVIVLASLDIGYLFYEKRELQKVADMAAIAGAQQMSRGSPGNRCSGVETISRNAGNANKNATDTITVSCGIWDPMRVPAAPHFITYAGGIVPSGNPDANAVMVFVEHSYQSLTRLGARRTVVALGIASIDTPTAVFSIGSRLLSIKQDGTIPTLVKSLGVDVSGTDLISYNGLATAPVQTSGLLRALGFNIDTDASIGTVKDTLRMGTSQCPSGSCPLGTLLSAIGNVGGQNNLASLLRLPSDALNLQVKLLDDATGRGLLAILDTANGRAALESELRAFDLLSTALGVANSRRFKDLQADLNLPGIAGVTSKVGIVEAPSIGIGGIGTKAYTAQVRLFSHVQTNNLTNNLLRVDLPLAVDVISGHGTITNMCNARNAAGRDTATIAIEVPIMRACVGELNANTVFSQANACTTTPANHEILNVLNGVLRISSSFTLNGLPGNATVTLAEGETVTVGANNLQIGTTVTNLLKGLLAGTLGKLLANGQGNVTNSDLASGLLGATNNSLSAATQTLDTTLKSLRTFVLGLDSSVTALLGGSLSSGIVGLLNSVGSLVNGLLTSVGKLLGDLLGSVGCLLSGTYNQCALAKELSGTQGSGANTISNVMLSLLALVETALEPVLNNLGAQLAGLLNNLLGVQLGQVDVTLIDLNCGGGENVRLVH